MTYTYLATPKQGKSLFDVLRATLLFCQSQKYRLLSVSRLHESCCSVVVEE